MVLTFVETSGHRHGNAMRVRNLAVAPFFMRSMFKGLYRFVGEIVNFFSRFRCAVIGMIAPQVSPGQI
jgi:hypothetical protein